MINSRNGVLNLNQEATKRYYPITDTKLDPAKFQMMNAIATTQFAMLKIEPKILK
jgi:hypothetical protein